MVLHITSSLFLTTTLNVGYMSYSGGGMLINTSYNASRVPQHIESNRVYINNTEFMGNHADTGGTMSVFPCTGTELHINDSKFHI